VKRIKPYSILGVDQDGLHSPSIPEPRGKGEGGIFDTAGNPGGLYGQHLGRFKVMIKLFIF
jgi:hypothetical protein